MSRPLTNQEFMQLWRRRPWRELPPSDGGLFVVQFAWDNGVTIAFRVHAPEGEAKALDLAYKAAALERLVPRGDFVLWATQRSENRTGSESESSARYLTRRNFDPDREPPDLLRLARTLAAAGPHGGAPVPKLEIPAGAARRFRLFAPPTGSLIPLEIDPQLASWDRTGHPSQLRLAKFLDHLVSRLPGAAIADGSLTFGLNVGLPAHVPILIDHDVENYLYPAMTRLRLYAIESVWGEKAHRDRSTVVLCPAEGLSLEALAGWSFAYVRTQCSTAAEEWKHAVWNQVASQAALAPDGGLEMQVAYRVGSSRAWLNVWKPSIDALGSILGVKDPRRPFDPRDDRIIRLGLHRNLDRALGNDVEIGIWWRPVALLAPSLRGGAVTSPPSTLVVAAAPPAHRPVPPGPALGGVVEFRRDDAGYRAWLTAHPDGFVINTTPRYSRTYLKLHRATCPSVSQLQPGYSTWTAGAYIKVCGLTRVAIQEWAHRVVGAALQDGCACRP
jgi:hypothetical protein